MFPADRFGLPEAVPGGCVPHGGARLLRGAGGVGAAVLLGTGSWSVTGVAPGLALWWYLAVVSLPLCAWDIAWRRLPNRLVLPGFAAGAFDTAWSIVSGVTPWPMLAAGGACFGFFFLLALWGGMGMGDVKLAGVVGLALGAVSMPAAVLGPMIAFVCGGVLALTVWAWPALREAGIPFGPCLLLGLWTAPFLAG